METHAQHYHHIPGKGWRHYFYEFLMLFLAVFCGFIAENLREKRVEHHRERQFMASMVKDLQADTAMVNYVLKDSIRVNGFDSLVRILLLPSIPKMDVRKAYQLNAKYIFAVNQVFFARNTMTQLKNSGNMRLIKNRILVDSLNLLDNYRALCDVQMEEYTHAYRQTCTAEGQIFDFANYVLHADTSSTFMTKDITHLHAMAFNILIQQGSLDSYHSMLKEYLGYCDHVIFLIKKEYDL
jgi:hypothetical protein